MNIEPTLIPTTLDGVHLGLAALSFILLIICMSKSSSKSPGETPEQESDKGEQSAESAAQEQASPPAKAAPVAEFSEAKPDAALQLLALLQQEARFVDFVNEELGGHSDAEIGAVARIVHEGAAKTIKEYFQLDPIRAEQEESRITVAEGFNPAEIRLTGNVVGSAPFSGTLVHRGWKATNIKLPQLAAGHDATVVAAAEVEL